MKLTFFASKTPGSAPAPPRVSVRPNGAIALNSAAMTALNAEHGEAATVCYEEESEQWLLAHWPEGNESQPTLRALTGKKSRGLRFQTTGAAHALFEALPVALRTSTSVSCLLNPEPITSEDALGASFYVLTLPDASEAAAAGAAPKQPGVGRGHYDRSASKKGAGRG